MLYGSDSPTVNGCPHRYIRAGSDDHAMVMLDLEDLVHAWRASKKGCFPVQGGWADQPAQATRLFAVLDDCQASLEREEAKKVRESVDLPGDGQRRPR